MNIPEISEDLDLGMPQEVWETEISEQDRQFEKTLEMSFDRQAPAVEWLMDAEF